MKDLIKRNYDSIVKRGLITPKTDVNDFIDKFIEEYNELRNEIIDDYFSSLERNEPIVISEDAKFELADVILVCLNLSKHYDIDIEYYLNEKVKINESRVK